MFRPLLIAALIALPATAPVVAQTNPANAQAETGQPPQRIRNVQLTKGQTCPRASGDEIVVCSTLDEPYRIPKALRDDKPIPAAGQSWVNRAETVDNVGRVAGGLPDTCSPVGTGGQSGCSLARARAYSAERRAAQSEVPTN